jgi:hypothetical protein
MLAIETGEFASADEAVGAATIIHFRFPFFLFIHRPGMVGGSGSRCNPLVLSVPVAATG